MSQLSADQKWVRMTTDGDKTRPDDPESWLDGTYVANSDMNAKCDDPSPSTWGKGGALYICVEALKAGEFVAAICSKGVDTDTPDCAAFQTLNGDMITTTSTDCPIAT